MKDKQEINSVNKIIGRQISTIDMLQISQTAKNCVYIYSDVIQAVSYSECGSYFVTAGTRHLKFWYPIIKETESSLAPVPEGCIAI